MEEKLEAHLKLKMPQWERLSVTELNRVTGGMSSMSYYFTLNWQDSQGRHSETLVMRMMPDAGPVPPYDVRPQCDSMKAVYGTGIPVPKVHLMEEDSSVLGYPFFIMEKIEGEVMMNIYNSEPEHQNRLTAEYIGHLAKLHSLDWQTLGLTFLKPPENNLQYAENEIKRWERLMDENRYGPQPLLTEAFVWLKRNIPPARRISLCHGDYTAANIFCRDGHISAIFDWELTALGDPISDIGFACMMDDVLWNFWDDAHLIKAYEKASGVKVNEDVFYYWKVMGYVKLACCGFGAFRAGIESKDLEVQQLGLHSVLMRRIYNSIVEIMKF